MIPDLNEFFLDFPPVVRSDEATTEDDGEDEVANENINYKQKRGDPDSPVRAYDDEGNELRDPHANDPNTNPLTRRQREKQEAEKKAREEEERKKKEEEDKKREEEEKKRQEEEKKKEEEEKKKEEEERKKKEEEEKKNQEAGAAKSGEAVGASGGETSSGGGPQPDKKKSAAQWGKEYGNKEAQNRGHSGPLMMQNYDSSNAKGQPATLMQNYS